MTLGTYLPLTMIKLVLYNWFKRITNIKLLKQKNVCITRIKTSLSIHQQYKLTPIDPNITKIDYQNALDDFNKYSTIIVDESTSCCKLQLNVSC